MSKKCKGCQEIKDESEFYTKDKRTGRLSCHCKECLIVRMQERIARDPEKHRRDCLARYYENRDEKIKQTRDYQKRNKVTVDAYKRLYRKTHPEKDAQDRHRRRPKINADEGDFTSEQWRLLCVKYNYTCLCCHTKAEDTPEGTMTIDHVIPLSKGGSNHISNIQPLCRSCNSKKHRKTIDYRTY